MKESRFFSRTTRGWARGAVVGYFGKNERKKKEKKRICVGNEIKIKLGGRGGRGGTREEKGNARLAGS